MLSEKLRQIGLSGLEASAYLELLKVGPQPASVVAKRLNSNRSTIYSVLKSLASKGLISLTVKNGVKLFIANDPNCLVGFIDKQCRTFDYYRAEMLKTIPEFRSLSGNFQIQAPAIKYFEGLEGVKQLLEDALNAQDVLMTYYPLGKWLNLGLKDYLLDFKQRRVENGITLKAIVPDIAAANDFFTQNYENRDIADVNYIPPKSFPDLFTNDINIYNDRVSILHLEKGAEYGVLICNPELAAMQKTIFDLAWKSLKKG